MTAEICVMNSLAVALAADSAVSLGGDSGKVYSSSDKLFQLSHSAPIGIMIYNNANFLGVPWETVIKVYRRQLGEKRFAKTDEYAKDFFTFLEKRDAMLTVDAEIRCLIRLIDEFLVDLREALLDHLDAEANEADGLTDDEVRAIVADVVPDYLKELTKAQEIWSPPPDRRIVLDAVEKGLEASISKVFGDDLLTSEVRDALAKGVLEMLCRRHFGPNKTGVVVAGFGEDEFQPAMSHYQCEGKLLSRLRIEPIAIESVSEKNNASIAAFAQRDTVKTFLEGIDSNLFEHIKASTRTLFLGAFATARELVAADSPELAAKLEAKLRPEIVDKLSKLTRDWQNAQRNHWSPVVQMVAALPKDELASMAEALVNLTKFRRRVTPERETVGGPIDVAVISKGDGFVWVKRKHYFDPALNPRILARLQTPAGGHHDI